MYAHPLYPYYQSLKTNPSLARLEPVQSFRYPPITAFKERLFKLLMSVGTPYARPVSVEHEARKRRRRRAGKVVVWVVALLMMGWGGAELGRRVVR